MPARFSVSQFDQMIESGALVGTEGRTIQLMRGEVMYMSPPGPRHDDVIYPLTSWAYESEAILQSPVEACVQLSLILPDQDSVVSPDLVFIAAKSYAARRPTPADTYLLIEVSDATLAYDTGDKCALYAEASVGEYWVIDVPHRSVIVHRDPCDGRYRSVQTFTEKDSVEPLRLPGISLSIDSLFR